MKPDSPLLGGDSPAARESPRRRPRRTVASSPSRSGSVLQVLLRQPQLGLVSSTLLRAAHCRRTDLGAHAGPPPTSPRRQSRRASISEGLNLGRRNSASAGAGGVASRS